MGILDFGFWILDFGFWILGMERGRSGIDEQKVFLNLYPSAPQLPSSPAPQLPSSPSSPARSLGIHDRS
jgi:hypothetical protein